MGGGFGRVVHLRAILLRDYPLSGLNTSLAPAEKEEEANRKVSSSVFCVSGRCPAGEIASARALQCSLAANVKKNQNPNPSLRIQKCPGWNADGRQFLFPVVGPSWMLDFKFDKHYLLFRMQFSSLPSSS